MPISPPMRREAGVMNTKPKIFRTQAEQDLIRQFDQRFLTGNEGLSSLRRDAFADLREAGLPHRRVEDYRYTDLKAAFATIPDIAARPDLQAARTALADVGVWGDLDRHQIVFADGYYFPELSSADAPGLSVRGLAAALADGDDVTGRIGQLRMQGPDAALDLNTAFMVDGAMVAITADWVAGKALEFVFLTAGGEETAQYVRTCIVVEDGASVQILETHAGPDGLANHSNVVFEASVGDAAHVDWIKVQKCGDRAMHLGTTLTTMGRQSDFDHFVFTLGSKLSRSQSFLTFAQEGSTANLRGITLLRGKEHADVTLLVDHAVPACTSQERFKAVIDDQAKGVFQGKIIVRPLAQKTDGRMMTQTLLLSDDAHVANKPELEIFADDVQCAHGATTGQIDEDLMFYLMARGIPEGEARILLILAFIGATIEEIGDAAVVERLEAMSRIWLLGEGADL